MADESARFSIDLEGNAAAHARDDAQALEQLQEAIQGDIGALRQMQGALRNLQGASQVSIQTVRSLKDQISAQKATIAKNTQAFVDMGGKFSGVKTPAKIAKGGIQDLVNSMRAAPGPVGAATGKIDGLWRSLAAGGGAMAIVAVMGMIVGAVVRVAAGVVKFGLAQADARRSELLHLEALTKLRIGYMGMWAATGRAAMSGKQLQGIIDDISGTVALSRAEIGNYTDQLYKMGLRGQNLKDALEGTSITAATQGDAAAQSFASWAAGANATGQSIRRLTDDVKARLGPIAKAQLLTISVQMMKFRENLSTLFSGAKIEPILLAFKEITDMFSQSTAMGRALKGVVERIFVGVGHQIQPLPLLVKRFFQGVVIGSLLAENAILRLQRWWRKTFGDATIFQNVNWGRVVLIGAATATLMLVGALVTLTALAAGGLAIVVAPFVLMYKWQQKCIDMGRQLGESFSGLIDKFRGAGKDAGAGLLSGLASTGGPLGAAAANLGAKALQAFRDKLQIRSPSRKFFEAAGHIGGGAVLALRASKPAVQRAAAELVETPKRATMRRQLADVISLPRPGVGLRAAASLRPTVVPMRPEPPRRDGAPPNRVRASVTAGPRSHGAAPITMNVTIEQINVGSGDPKEIQAAVSAALEVELRKVAAHLGATAGRAA
jgi:hypothetical protein